MPTRDEVLTAVAAAFPDGWTEALGVIDRYGTAPHERERERVQLAMIALAMGSLERLEQLVADARRDYRDVLAWHDAPLSPREGERLRQAARDVLEKWGKR